MTNSKWSTPTLKARWYDDESIAPVGVAIDLDADADLAAPNMLKPTATALPVVAQPTDGLLDGPFAPDEPATG